MPTSAQGLKFGAFNSEGFDNPISPYALAPPFSDCTVFLLTARNDRRGSFGVPSVPPTNTRSGSITLALRGPGDGSAHELQDGPELQSRSGYDKYVPNRILEAKTIPQVEHDTD